MDAAADRVAALLSDDSAVSTADVARALNVRADKIRRLHGRTSWPSSATGSRWQPMFRADTCGG
jgi:hypothetical protein